MGFTIESKDTAQEPSIQSVWYDTDIAILERGVAGVGVLTGCGVTAQGSPDMTVAVAAGTIQPSLGAAAVAVSSGNVTVGAAHASLPRLDLITASAAGVKTITAGTAATSPKPAALPSGHIALALVYIPGAATTITTARITDKRVTVVALNLAGKEIDYAEFTSTVGVTATTEGGANTVVSGNSVAFDGAAARVDFFAMYATPDNGAIGRQLNFWLYVDGASVGQIGQMVTPAAQGDRKPVCLHRRLTLSAGNHTVAIMASVNAGTGFVEAGAGGTATPMPGYIQITKV
jgi:hypothetical protein